MNMRQKIVIGLAIVAALALVISFWPKRYEATFYPMGGIPFKIVVYGRNFIQFDKDFSAAEEEVGRLEKAFNLYDKSSELSKLNADAQHAMFRPSEDLDNVLALSRKWHRITNGAFDPTILPILSLWKEAGENGKIPGPTAIAETLTSVGLDKVESVDEGKIRFSKKGMGLDFGGIAKGYIVDKAIVALKERGVKRGIAEAGGDAYAFGEGTFRFGIQDPAGKGGENLMGTVEIPEGAVVTSGDYERYVEIGGKRYSHIANPHTGWPADNNVISVTAVGGSAADADALATSIMVMGLERGMALLKELEGQSALIIKKTPADFEVWASKDLIPRLNLTPQWATKIRPF